MNVATLLWSFKGRINRAKFWLAILLSLLLLMAFAVVAGIVSGVTNASEDATDLVVTVAILAWIVSLVPVHVKRLHDFDQSGWLGLLLLVPLIDLIIFFICGCMPGTEGPNRYGPDPLGRTGPAEAPARPADATRAAGDDGPLGGQVEGLFQAGVGVVVQLRDGRVLAPVAGEYRSFGSVGEYRQLSKDQGWWREITDAAEKRSFFAAKGALLEQAKPAG